MHQLQAHAKVYKGDVYPDDWVVYAVGSDGDIVVAVFSGLDAQELAIEYATAKYSSHAIVKERPQVRLVTENGQIV